MASQPKTEIETPETCVTRIRDEINAAQNSRLWRDSINMLNTVSESVFSRSAHFILELLQNAEDACARAKHEGQIVFRISPDQIQVTHNGALFTPEDVSAICGVRSTKQPEQETLGFLGIGFKSVFKVTYRPQIHSGGFHFKFDRGAHAQPANVPWQILPIWDDSDDKLRKQKNTVFTLPFRKPEFYAQTLEELRRLDVHVFLFLRRLSRVVIIDSTERKRTVIKNQGEHKRILTLTKNNEPSRFVIFRRTCPVPPDVANDPALEFYKRQNVAQREIVLAFGVDQHDNLQPISDASTLGSVSSFLPLVEERSGAKFLVQGDFLVQPGREAIQYELSWNHWLIKQAAELAKEAIEEFKNHKIWSKQFLPLFEHVDYSGQPPFDKLFKPELHHEMDSYLSTSQVHSTDSGTFVAPNQAVYLEDELDGLVTDVDLPLLFPGQSGLGIAGLSSTISTLPKAVGWLVKQLNVLDVARRSDWLKSKLQASNHVRWFSAFFAALARSGRSFKTIPVRDRRGRIAYSDVPISILTERNSIVPANQVYLRDIPADVVTLRKKFPAVENVLSTYELIHPALNVPELVKFFKEQTHVQPIDFRRICTDVFLPRLMLTEKPPAVQDLIAYTRLLQKGPQFLQPIWVVTKAGTLKPSNQVFLPTEYSPSEDWEAGSSYAPQIDFLSADYLQGVPKTEIPAWKGFFLNAGARERGDNPYTRDFAMKYVETKLSKELSHFVTKDHQQHGYDLDSKRISDGLPIALEVKGQKKDAPVELIGNEPIAAQQAKNKGYEFWLCIVTGIPENPQLWIVDDPLTVGDYKTVTVDVSKWKTQGRRVK